MNGILLIKIDDLLCLDIDHLVKDSKQEGFRFIDRLVSDYHEGTNTFKGQGECLMGMFSEGHLVAIGGLNRDPFSKEERIGRLRRFYVSKEFRRGGIGRRLVNGILSKAQEDFEVVVLHTDTEQGDLFYRSLGFLKDGKYPNATHYIALG